MNLYESLNQFQIGDEVFIGSPGGFRGQVLSRDLDTEMYEVRREDGLVEMDHVSWLLHLDNYKRSWAADAHNSGRLPYRTKAPHDYDNRRIEGEIHLLDGSKEVGEPVDWMFFQNVSKFRLVADGRVVCATHQYNGDGKWHEMPEAEMEKRREEVRIWKERGHQRSRS